MSKRGKVEIVACLGFPVDCVVLEMPGDETGVLGRDQKLLRSLVMY